MAKNLIDIEDIPPQLANKVKQDLRFKTGNFVWRVRFNIPLDPHTVNKDTMYVTNSQNQKLRSYIRYDTKNEIIEVEPLEPYSTNEYYFLTNHKKCEVERRTVVEGASADQIQIIKVQIINYRDRNKSVPFIKMQPRGWYLSKGEKWMVKLEKTCE